MDDATRRRIKRLAVTLAFNSSSLSSGSALRAAVAGSTNSMGPPLAVPLGRDGGGLAGDAAGFWGLGLGMVAAGWDGRPFAAGAAASFCTVPLTVAAASFSVLATLPPIDDSASLAAPAVELFCTAHGPLRMFESRCQGDHLYPV